jgi:hypothetical protein
MPSKPSLLAALAALIALLLAGPAQALAASAPASPTPSAVFASLFAEAEESEAEASEDGEVEDEWCDVVEDEEECEEAEGETGSDEAPPACLLSSAEATVFAAANRDRVRLQIRYKTASPTAVTIAYGLHGNKGSLFLGDEKKRFGKKGVLRLDRELTETQMAKVVAAKDFTVRIRALGAPGWCQPYFDRQLDVRRATPSGFSWEQSE